MSELGLGIEETDEESDPSSHRRRRRFSFASCLAVLVALVIVFGGGYVALSKGVDFLSSHLGGPADYPGPGSGKVLVQVHEGDSGADIGNTLKSKGVVQSVDAFTAAFAANPDAQGIQVGYYELLKQMKASDAVELLADHGNLIENNVAVPEGLRVTDVVALLAKGTDFSKADFQKVLDKPAKIGLPKYAGGNAEGYLFPATYAFPPKSTPTSMLKAMVDRWRQATDKADLAAAADRLGYSQKDLMTIASLVEAEARGNDMPKVARVIYNRLEGTETGGLLQIDASVNYGLGQQLGVGLTSDQLKQDTPYNTYTRAGLPPTPIEAPGDDAIAAAINPAQGDWYYYVTVNLKTGETKFATTYDEFLQYKAEFKQYCQTSDAC